MTPRKKQGNIDASDIFLFSQKKKNLRWRSQLERKQVDLRELVKDDIQQNTPRVHAVLSLEQSFDPAPRLAPFIAKKITRAPKTIIDHDYEIVPRDKTETLPTKTTLPMSDYNESAKKNELQQSEALLTDTNSKMIAELSRSEILRVMEELDTNDAKLRKSWQITERTQEEEYTSQEVFFQRPSPKRFYQEIHQEIGKSPYIFPYRDQHLL